MIYQVLQDWEVGSVVVAKGTILNFDNPGSVESSVGRDRSPPLFSRALDDEAYQAQLKAYPDSVHLLGGAWR